ncbi:hypothetical protein PM082_018286 [Marasmius tenuissimus]|nr:hypothetical protein PM082_018286 [Marasmius tenuissimus]
MASVHYEDEYHYGQTYTGSHQQHPLQYQYSFLRSANPDRIQHGSAPYHYSSQTQGPKMAYSDIYPTYPLSTTPASVQEAFRPSMPTSANLTALMQPPSQSVPVNSAPPVVYTEDASTRLSSRVRRKCFNCGRTETTTWRRSTLTLGKVVCNKCGLYERTHARPRPVPYQGPPDDHSRTSTPNVCADVNHRQSAQMVPSNLSRPRVHRTISSPEGQSLPSSRSLASNADMARHNIQLPPITSGTGYSHSNTYVGPEYSYNYYHNTPAVE